MGQCWRLNSSQQSLIDWFLKRYSVRESVGFEVRVGYLDGRQQGLVDWLLKYRPV